ncbi:hypothetical protein CN918_27585 [Priestia megaterium]|nr:hypothetical protein CN918_27585 [Priestia megaterium]
MNKNKLGFYALIIGMLFILFGLLFVIFNKNKQADNSSNQTGDSAVSKFERETEKHSHYVQDEDLDPFKDINTSTGNLDINDLNFNFQFLKGATYENTAANLIGATDNILLFNNYTNVLTFYGIENQKKYVVDNHINQAIVTPDEEYIIYTKNAVTEEQFYYVDLTIGEKKQFETYKSSTQMKTIDMKYKDGLVYFLVEDYKTKKTSVHFVGLPGYLSKSTAFERRSVVPINADKLYNINNNVYAFNKDTNELVKIKPNNPTETLLEITSQKVSKILSIDYISNDKWAIALVNDKDERVIITPTGTIKTFEGLMGVKWFDKNHLIVNDNLSLYLYNLKTKKKAVIKSAITSFFSTSNSMYIQTNEGDVLSMYEQ